MKIKPMQILIFICCCIHSLNAQGLGLSVSTTPTNVSTVAVAQFTLHLTASSTQFVSGDTITITAPSPASFTSTAPTCTSAAGFTTITITSCVATTNTVTIKIAVSSGSTNLWIVTVSNFLTPYSTSVLSSISAIVGTASNPALASVSGISITGLTANTMVTTPTMSSSSDVIADQSLVKFTIKFTNVGTVKKDGSIQVTFPVWSSTTSMIIAGSQTCVGTSPLNTALSCSFSSSTNILTVTQVGSTDITTVQSLTFTVCCGINPYNGVPKSGFTITTLDSTGGSMDSSTAMTLTVSTPAQFTTGQVSIQVTPSDVVDELTELSILIETSLPLDAGCRLKLTFPTDMPLTSTLTNVILQDGFFDKSNSIVNSGGTYLTYDACSSAYTTPDSSGNQGFLLISSALNKKWVQATGSFQLSLYAIHSGALYNIINQTSGLSISTFEAGTVTAFSLSAFTQDVQASTTYTLTMQPAHYLPSSSQIVIQFPSSIGLTAQNPCTLTLTLASGTCVIASNTITITDPFGSSGVFNYGDPAFSFSFGLGGTNPSSARDAGTFIVSTYAVVSGTSYSVDSSSFTNVFTPSPTVMAASIFSLTSTQTCKQGVTYILKITPYKTIPINGQLNITFPTQISLSLTSLTSCSSLINSVNSTLTECNKVSSSPLSFQITDAFTTASYTNTNTAFYISLSGLTNPSSLSATSSFSVYTADSSGYAIENVTSGISISMASMSQFTAFSVSMANSTNGVSTTYTVTVTTNCPLTSPSKLVFTFPAEVTVPSSITCATGNLVSAVSCQIASSTVNATLTFSGTGNKISAGQSFSIKVSSIKNPSSTKPTSTYSNIVIYDSNNYDVNEYTSSVTSQTTTPAVASAYSLTQSSKALNTTTTYSIQYTSYNVMPSGATFLISYPSEIVPDSTLDTCYVKCASVQYTMSCTVSSSQKTIKMYGTGISTSIPASTLIQLVFGPVLNPTTNLYTISSLTVTSYADQSQLYTIDNVPNSLNPKMDCKYPCKTCNTTNQSACITCFPVDINNYLYNYNYSCLQSCPAGTYADSNNVCQKCSSRCLTCSNSSTNCTSCNSSSSYPDFYDNYCYSSCPSGTYALSGVCMNCTSPCNTCGGSSTNCTSCVTGSSKQYLSGGACIGACASGYISINYQCKKCTSPCLSCLIDQTTCTACTTGYLYGYNCVSKCPNGTVTKSGSCAGCDPNCMTCASSDTGICQQCLSGYLLYNNTCYKSCPSGYEPDSSDIQCQIIPVTTTVIVVSNGTSNYSNYTGNSTSTAASNDSTKIYAYFPTTISQSVMSGVSVASYLKDAASMPLSSSLGMWGPLELLSFGSQTYLSYQKQLGSNSDVSSSTSTNDSSTSRRQLGSVSATGVYPLIFYGSALSFIMKILTNIAYGIIHGCLLRKDKGYLEHRQKYKHTERCIWVLSILCSFKCSKFMYCNMFGHDRFYVPYQEPKRIHFILNILTVVNMAITLLPIIVVDIYALITYGWGDQFYVMILETFMLCLSTIIVTILEFRQNKNKQPYKDSGAYTGIGDMSSDTLMDELRKRFGQNGLDDFLKMLSAESGPKKVNGKRRCNSMPDLYRDLEVDERRVHTEPLDPEEKKRYESQPNPFTRNNYPDNVIAEPYKNVRQKLDPSKLRVIATQTGDKNKAEERKGQRLYEKETNDSADFDRKKNKNFKMRGRKDKYYEQVDDEDQTFAEDTLGNLMDDDKYEVNLGQIEEESQHTEEDENKNTLKPFDLAKHPQVSAGQTSPEKTVNKVESPVKEVAVEKSSVLQPVVENQKVQEEQVNPVNSMREMENQILQSQVVQEEDEDGTVDSDDDDEKRLRNMVNPDLRKFNVNDILGEFDRDDKGNLVMLQNKEGLFVDKNGTSVNEKGYLIDTSTGDVLEKEKRHKVFDKKDLDEKGEIPPPFNIEKYNFNPHDVRGHFDRDKNGNELIGNKKNHKNQYIDKLGRVVNSHGFLVDEAGNLVDKRGRIRLHAKQMEMGNLPLLFNYKGKKFDIKDVIGDLDKDRKGNMIIRRDKDNQMVDKKGRKVNSKGYLVDKDGNVVNKDGKIIFESFALSKDNEIPKLFPFLKFNVDDIKGDFEMDPLGNPELTRNPSGQLVDNKGREVNEKGYLIDQSGNIKNKRDKKVFGRVLIDKGGEIPKVFRTGLFRKDSADSFSQLMSEIEDLEKQHEEDSGHMKAQHLSHLRKEDMDENERIAKRIDQIVEEDNDDDEMLMKELEELANGRKKGGDERQQSEGGNTSFESLMDDTPSNYNVANQRFIEQEQLKERLRQANKSANVIAEDGESDYQKMKTRKKKKKKGLPPKEPVHRELLMAKAYGALSQTEVDKILLEKKKKDASLAVQMQKQSMFKNASISRVGSVHSKKRRGDDNTHSTQRIGDYTPKEKVRKNGYMQQTANSFKVPSHGSKSGTAQGDTQRKLNQVATEQNFKNKRPDREYNLTHITNSVSGFYRGDSASDNSKVRSIHDESNYAQNIPGAGGRPTVARDPLNDVELDRIYKTAKQFADISMLSDWEKDSLLSGDSDFSQYTGVANNNASSSKVRGLESIYLQRLEPASKGGKSSVLNKKSKKGGGGGTGEDKAKFRIMHHRFHDEPEWYVEEPKDVMGSQISDKKAYIEKRYKEEFLIGGGGGTGSGKKKTTGNIFHGNKNQYVDKDRRENRSVVDLDK